MSQLKPGRLIVVRRRRHLLDVYERDADDLGYDHVKRYPIAVGMKGHETPADMYEVQGIDRTPDYTYGDADWVREIGVKPGTVIPHDDPANPVDPVWIGISDDLEIGIHGTNRPEAIGTDASHGCIRLLPDDVIELARMVTPVRRRTPVFIY